MLIAVVYTYSGIDPETKLPFNGTGRTVVEAGVNPSPKRHGDVPLMRFSDVVKLEERALSVAPAGTTKVFMLNYYPLKGEYE